MLSYTMGDSPFILHNNNNNNNNNKNKLCFTGVGYRYIIGKLCLLLVAPLVGCTHGRLTMVLVMTWG
jgi:hypothetical protein